jgi:HK97 family phage major capsid protein
LGWEQIKSFMNSNPGQRARLQLFDEQEVKAAADMGIANIVNLGTALTTVLPGIDTLPNTAVHMRQIVPVGAMSGPSLTYMRETGGEGAPAPWLENSGAKAQIDRDFIEITVDAQYIAGWLRVSRKMLDDVVAFRSYLSTRLIEMYFDVEDEEILNGTGVAPRLTGLLPNATPAVSTTGVPIERIVRAIGQAEASKYPADGVILHPQDIVEIMLNKAAGSGEYDLPGMVVIQGGRLYIMGVPVFKTTAMPRGQYLVGAFRRGCMLFIRENPSIEFFDQDRDNVITNKITVRIEGRAALAIFRVEAFVKGTFTIVT